MKKTFFLIGCLMVAIPVIAQETITIPSSFDENQMITKKMDASGNFVPVGQPMPGVVRHEGPEGISAARKTMGFMPTKVPDEVKQRQMEVQKIQRAAVPQPKGVGVSRPTPAQMQQASGMAGMQGASIPGARGQYGSVNLDEAGAPEITAGPLAEAPIKADGSAGLAYEAPSVPVAEPVVEKTLQVRRLKPVMKKDYSIPKTTFSQDTLQKMEAPVSSFSTNTMPQAVKSFQEEAMDYVECAEGDKNCRLYQVDEHGEVIVK